jgi:predicted peroxiredoxin
MKRTLTAALVAATAFAAPAAQAEGPDTLVTVLTAPEPQTQLMAMVLTMQAAQQGVTPHILLCGPAGDLALKAAPASATAGQPPRDMSPQGLMQMIMKQDGARVEVCAIYLPGKGADASVLLDGVGVANPGEMAAAIVAPNARVMSY